MKKQKRNLGKIALLTAAMAVTVPSAVLLSACGGHSAAANWQADAEMHWHNCQTDAKDNHTYNLGEHKWTVDGTKCSVCGYVKGSVDEVRIQTIKDFWEKNMWGNSYTYQYLNKYGQLLTLSYDHVLFQNYETGQITDDVQGSLWTRDAVNGEDKVILTVYQNADGEHIACEYNDDYDPDDESTGPQYLFHKVNQNYLEEHAEYKEYQKTNFDNEFDQSWTTFNGIKMGQLFRGSAADFWENARDVFGTDVKVTTAEKDGAVTVAIYQAGVDNLDYANSLVLTLDNGVFAATMKEYATYENEDGTRDLKNFFRQTNGYEAVALPVEEPSTIEEKFPELRFDLRIDTLLHGPDNGIVKIPIEFVTMTLPVAYGTVLGDLNVYAEQIKDWVKNWLKESYDITSDVKITLELPSNYDRNEKIKWSGYRIANIRVNVTDN